MKEFMHTRLDNKSFTDDEIKSLIKEYNIKFIKLQFVDINGHRIPNVLGRDTFVYVLRDNTLVPAGFDKNDDELRSDCKMSGTGNFCAAYLEKNGYKLDY